MDVLEIRNETYPYENKKNGLQGVGRGGGIMRRSGQENEAEVLFNISPPPAHKIHTYSPFSSPWLLLRGSSRYPRFQVRVGRVSATVLSK